MRRCRPVHLAAGALAVLVALAGCGSGPSSGGAGGPSGDATPAVAKDAALAAKLPPEIQSAGVIRVATDETYPPFESVSNGEVVGLDPDLARAIGGVLGSITGLWATKILGDLIPATLPTSLRLDPRIFGFSAAIITLASFLFGLIPALITSRADVNEALKEGGLRLGTRAGTHRLRGMMSAGEIGLSLILLVGAGLLVRSFLRLTEVDLGFDPNNLLVATVERPLTAAFDSQQHSAFFQASLERIRNLPGVKEAALTQRYPLGSAP